MKLIKKVFLILFVTLFIFLGFSISGKADDSKSDNEQATWTSENETIKKIGDLTHSLAYGKTTYPGLSDGNQKVNAFSMKTDGVNSKLVTWAIQRNNNMYSRSTLTSIAKNYEETHPGWIVLAGVNGDQYYATYGSGFVTNGSFFYYNQPYYPMIVDGERRFAITPTGVSASNYVGVKNDGSSSSLLAASALKGLRVEILDENNEITSWYDVDAINETPAEGKTAVWISYNSATSESEKITFDVTSTGNIYLVEVPEFSYMSNNHNYPIGSKTDALFSRGVISKVAKQVKVDANQFAIETLNEELKYRQIHVLAICPYWVETEFFDRAVAKDKKPVVIRYGKVYKAKDVIKKAIKDMESSKDVSLYGTINRIQILGMKVLPHRLVKKIWMIYQELDGTKEIR